MMDVAFARSLSRSFCVIGRRAVKVDRSTICPATVCRASTHQESDKKYRPGCSPAKPCLPSSFSLTHLYCNEGIQSPAVSRRFCFPLHSSSRNFSHYASSCSKNRLFIEFKHGTSLPVVPSRSYFEGFYISLTQSSPVQSLQGLLLDFHHWSGLPWWSIIALSTLAIRSVIVLPLAVHQMQVVTRLAKINAEIAHLVPELNKEVAMAKKMYGFDTMHAKKLFKRQLRIIYKRSVLRDNCHPFKTVLLVLIQMPIWVCLSVSLRNLTFMAQRGTVPDMKSEGLLWFPDLTVPDPILIPLMLLTVNLTLTQVHALRQMGKGTLLQKVLINGSRVAIVVVAVAATFNPSSVTFYWLCSSTFGLGQSLLLLSPKVKRALNIPSSANDSPTPYRDIADKLRRTLKKAKE